MKNIHVLLTNKPSKLYKSIFWDSKDKQKLKFSNIPIFNNSNFIKYNTYITSDEEIKVNDYITDGYKVWKWKDESSLLGRKKIILTTDQDLIKDDVQSIDDEFLEWFVKNPSCEEIKINYEIYKEGVGLLTSDWRMSEDDKYKIIIPKEEPYSEIQQNSLKLNKIFVNSIDIKSLDNIMSEFDEPKQETLEEAAANYANKELNSEFTSKVGNFYGFSSSFIEGAKWQAEKMYSEEEVKEILFHRETHYIKTGHHLHINEWFKQFKKK